MGQSGNGWWDTHTQLWESLRETHTTLHAKMFVILHIHKEVLKDSDGFLRGKQSKCPEQNEAAELPV